MSKAETTAQKRNAYNIRSVVNQSIFKEFMESQGEDCFKYTTFAAFDRPSLSALASIASRAVMQNPRLDVVLKNR